MGVDKCIKHLQTMYNQFYFDLIRLFLSNDN